MSLTVVTVSYHICQASVILEQEVMKMDFYVTSDCLDIKFNHFMGLYLSFRYFLPISY